MESNNFASTNMYTPYQNGPIPYNQPERAGMYRETNPNKEMEKREMAAVKRGENKSNNTSSAYLDTRGTYSECCCCCICCHGCSCCRWVGKECLGPCCQNTAACCKCIKESPLCKCISKVCDAIGTLH